MSKFLNIRYMHRGQYVPNWFDLHHLGFINLVLYVFRRHTARENEKLFYIKASNIRTVNDLWPRPWLYSRVFILFAVTFAMLYTIWVLEGRGTYSTLLPGITIVGALAVPMSMLIFFYECNTFRTIPILQALSYMLIGAVASISVTFLLLFLFDWGMNISDVVNVHIGYHSICPVYVIDEYINEFPLIYLSISATFEEFSKTLVIFFIMMRHRHQCYIFQGMLIGASVGAGFAVFESAGYALIDCGNLLVNILYRGLVAPVCHTAWGAIIGAGTMMLTGRRKLRWRLMFNPKFSLMFLCVAAMHSAWNYFIDRDCPINYNLCLGIFTIYVLMCLIWAAVRQVRHYKRLGYLPISY